MMGAVYDAEEWETGVLRAVFGPLVASAAFYDADFPEETGDRFEWVVAFDDDNEEIAGFGPADPRWSADIEGMTVGDIPAERGETVKFWVSVPELKCEGHESPGGATVFCYGACSR